MKNPSSKELPKRGRPKTPSDLSRPNRVVTFVTDMEKSQLHRVAQEEDRSLASVVHRIIKAHFEE
jgi:hypothetical protein